MTQPTVQPIGSPYAGLHLGSILYEGGTPVRVGDALDFGYKMSFIGGAAFTQEMSPVPEPSTLALIGMASLALLGYRWRKRIA